MRRFTANATHLAASLAVTAAAIVAAFALPVPAHAVTITFSGGDGNFVNGSGKMVDAARKVGAFTVLRLDSSIDVHAHQGAAPGVSVHADDNIEPLVETSVEGDTLVVRMKKGSSFRTNHNVVVDVTFTTLTAAQQHGSGDLHIDKLSGPKFESTIAGSGDLQIESAQLGSFALSIAGSGDVDARRLVAKRVSVSVSGSGDAHVNASDSIDAKVAGSGDVSYAGHPHDVSRRVSGSGSIEAAN